MKDAKILGGIGAILSLLSFIPHIGVVLGIIGLVLILIAVKYISDIVRDSQIFKNMIIAIIAGIIGVALSFLMFFTVFIGIILGRRAIPPRAGPLAIIGGMIAVLIVLWIAFIVEGVFIRRCYNRIAELTGVNVFKTTGLLYFIGAILVIVLIGGIVLLVAKILEAVSFFSLPETYTPVQPKPPPPPPPPPPAQIS